MLYVYGYNGFDGRDKNTCDLKSQTSVDQNKQYYTEDTSYGEYLWWLKEYGVCSYVLFFTNYGKKFDYVTISI